METSRMKQGQETEKQSKWEDWTFKEVKWELAATFPPGSLLPEAEDELTNKPTHINSLLLLGGLLIFTRNDY